MRILAMHAHPDDTEFLAGGTLALLARAGHSLTIVTMTPGDCGSAELEPDEISRIRRAEAASAAALVGAEYHCAEFRDLAIFNEDPARRRVVEMLRRTRPEIVLTSSPQDYMTDHETTSTLVRDACFVAPMRNYRTALPDSAPPLPAIPYLYFMDPLGGTDREGRPIAADFYVDVEPVFALKQQMLEQHASQREWLRAHHGVDEYLEAMQRWTRERARQAGLNYAEGFRQYRGHAYPSAPKLQELLTLSSNASPSAAPATETRSPE